ncbi:MAG: ABC transporter permease [Candidatus Rokubacteria bacterium]|nr:ABC transporter permease [Chloroflexota bacterium]MBM4442725.1 ABC transporter permease [Candidatus Rokubacteria bacterium]
MTVATQARARLRGQPPRSGWLVGRGAVLRFGMAVTVAMVAFGLVLLSESTNPLGTLRVMWDASVGTEFGRTEVLVKVIPFGLCALAVAVPARVGLINVGGEGQFYVGAWAAAGAVLYSGLPGWALLPAAFVAGATGGGAWAALVAVLRVKGKVNEAVSSLLLNFVAIQFVNYFVYGPWKDPRGPNWPFSPKFPDAAMLPTVYGDRLSIAIAFVAVGLVAMFLVLRYTRIGYHARVVGGNAVAAERSGIPVGRYLFWALVSGGAIAGLAGMAEVTGIQGRLRPGISVNYGYIGFLAAWLGGHRPLGILFACLLFGAISVGGDSLQLALGLPGSTVNILMALILFAVLAGRKNRTQVRA